MSLLLQTLCILTFLTVSLSAEARPNWFCMTNGLFELSPQKKAEKQFKKIMMYAEADYNRYKWEYDDLMKRLKDDGEETSVLMTVRFSNVELNINRETIVEQFGMEGFQKGEALFSNVLTGKIDANKLPAKDKKLLSEMILRELLEERHSLFALAMFNQAIDTMKFEQRMYQAKGRLIQSQIQLAKVKNEDTEPLQKLLEFVEKQDRELEQKIQTMLRKDLLGEENNRVLRRKRLQQMRTIYPAAKNDLIFPSYQSVYDEKGQRRTLEDIQNIANDFSHQPSHD